MPGNPALKRAFDISAASLGLILTAPLQAVAALAVRSTMGAPVLFRQARPGLDGKIFTLLKFRTMKPLNVAKGQLEDAQRLTRIGALLRSTSIDELPELWNVLRGDMSIVGPRPLLVEYLALYSPEQARRHEVRPGLTGLAQTSGRNALGWDERFDLDVSYVDSWTLRRDLAILWRTVMTVLRRDGISAHDSVTMERFTGSKTSTRHSAESVDIGR